MSTTRSRHLATILLVVGAVIFGMVLAGGLQLTVPGSAEPQQAVLSASQIASSNGGAIRALPSFADLAQAVDPAVVSIQAATIEKRPSNRGGGGVDPFEFFFGPRQRPDQQSPQQRPNPRQQPGQPGQDDEDYRSDSGGSGFVISRDGLVVTNYHVIEGATNVKVHLGDRDYPAQIKGSDPETDIALLKIDAGNSLRYLELGDSETVRVGDWVMVIGNPLNLDKTVTTGVVSAKGRSLGIGDISFENFIQTDAAINFGNSGGPIVDMQGNVIAIATAINYGAENIGFAVPVNTLKNILPQLREKGKVSRGYLGIDIGNLDYEQAQAFGLDAAEGALVSNVRPDTPAADAGIEHGDVILTVDGRKVKTTRDLIDYVSSRGPSATVTLEVLRDGKRLNKQVKLRERPADGEPTEEVEKPAERNPINWLGLDYQDINQNTRGLYGLPRDVEGVVVTDVRATSPLYEKGVRPGNVVLEVNGQEVKSTAEFEKVVSSLKSGSFMRLYLGVFGSNGQRGQFFAVTRVP